MCVCVCACVCVCVSACEGGVEREGWKETARDGWWKGGRKNVPWDCMVLPLQLNTVVDDKLTQCTGQL